jgi:tRNA-dihydrouridine synthase 3
MFIDLFMQPFRRLCVSLGADITCSEMGLATSFLSATTSEWSLVRRHPSEKTFGVQLAGNKPSSLVPAAEVIAKEFGEEGSGKVDFVDLNCGCPIDMVFNSGSGSARTLPFHSSSVFMCKLRRLSYLVMNTATKLGKIVVGMSKALGEIPVTVKMRTGIKDGYNNAHKLMPRLANEWGASALTVLLSMAYFHTFSTISSL